ncbi:MAG: hypothetical protein IJJ71_05745, partial [Treponema sp.]|uniref:hypothetical protein n=1 Tax=Treponema sp. TaxID=166 RepID=UPI0025D248AC
MKKRSFLIFVTAMAFMVVLFSCDAQSQFQLEAYDAKYKSTYATTVNKLEMEEGNFNVYRRVIFYNVRLGETVFAC